MVWTQAAFMIELRIVPLDSSTSIKPWSDLDVLRLFLKSDQPQCTNSRQNLETSVHKALVNFLRTVSVSAQSLSHFWLFAIPWTAAHQASLSITNSWSLSKPMSIKLLMPSNHLILCHPLLPPTFNLSQHQGLFKWVSCPHQVAKVLEFQLHQQSFQWILRVGFL